MYCLQLYKKAYLITKLPLSWPAKLSVDNSSTKRCRWRRFEPFLRQTPLHAINIRIYIQEDGWGVRNIPDIRDTKQDVDIPSGMDLPCKLLSFACIPWRKKKTFWVWQKCCLKENFCLISKAIWNITGSSLKLWEMWCLRYAGVGHKSHSSLKTLIVIF